MGLISWDRGSIIYDPIKQYNVRIPTHVNVQNTIYFQIQNTIYFF